MARFRLIKFARGPDKRPRKRRKRKILSSSFETGKNAVLNGVGTGGTLITGSYLLNPENTKRQKILGRAGFLAGAGYGLYKGISAARARRRR